jgi:hypothetical protein
MREAGALSRADTPVQVRRCAAGRQVPKQAVLFFKKKPKNFCSLGDAPVVSGALTNGVKVFCFFFSKKKYFLSS